MSQTKACLVCNHHNQTPDTIELQELQLGLKEKFTYQFCSNCSSLQIVDVPENLGKYYPNEDYYSFNLEIDFSNKKDVLRKIKTDYLLFGKQPVLGYLLSIGYKPNEIYDWVKYTKSQYNSSILDVGTGNGSLLSRLQKLGFTNLTGIDPFINESKDYGNIKILKKDLFEMEGKFDVIMMHHSLEHTLNPQQVLAKVYSLLNKGGRALIRVPIMGNYGYKTYKEFWCGLDAPRHIFIPTENGLKQMCTAAGFAIDKFYYDSSEYVLWCSEQYKMGIPLHDKKSHLIDNKNSHFSREEILRLRKIIVEENKKNNGDMACIYLSKK